MTLAGIRRGHAGGALSGTDCAVPGCWRWRPFTQAAPDAEGFCKPALGRSIHATRQSVTRFSRTKELVVAQNGKWGSAGRAKRMAASAAALAIQSHLRQVSRSRNTAMSRVHQDQVVSARIAGGVRRANAIMSSVKNAVSMMRFSQNG